MRAKRTTCDRQNTLDWIGVWRHAGVGEIEYADIDDQCVLSCVRSLVFV